MNKIILLIALAVFVACDRESDAGNDPVVSRKVVESFETSFDGDFQYGYTTEDIEFEYFYNEEFGYWGGFAQSKKFDADAANGLYENQYAVYNDSAATGNSFLVYYYDSYNEPCDIIFNKTVMLESVRLNLSTYTYASITDEDINTFARVFTDGDYLKVVFTPLDTFETPIGPGTECYVVDYRDGKRFIADDWQTFYLGTMLYGNMRITIETTDVGEWGANTPLYICVDDLTYSYFL